MSKANVVAKVNKELEMIFHDKSLSPQDRGELGEKLVTRLVRYWADNFPNSMVEESFIFPQGPIMPTTNSMEKEPVTEIDCLLATPYKIFVIEIKTVYGDLVINDDYTMELFKNGKPVDKFSHNYLKQNEMHARHLYYHLHKVIPEGDTRYIEQVLILTGNMTVEDNRNPNQKRAHVTVTNNILSLLEELNQPLDFLISMKATKKILNNIRVLNKQRLLDSQKF